MIMKFKCTLLSDLVLNETSSSEGKQRCLDFIPGNNFLGIVASELYSQLSMHESAAIFHSGKIRFGDAHPSDGIIRGLRVPASMFYPKMSKATEECYIHHLIKDQDGLREKQLKQCREGFYLFDVETKIGTKVNVEKNFSIKSAYNSEKRKSEDKCMFGYESLPEGVVMYFEVDSDLEDDINKKIEKALIGKKRIGRSRSAQYGLVKIEKSNYKDSYLAKETDNDTVVVYADGRLIFFNDNGEPISQPTATDLGLGKGDIDLSNSQIRTFQYSPWNGKRHTYDTDRCGIEKGSVFVVKNCSGCPKESQYVGAYKNEGFGKVIYNPDFLLGKDDDGNGRALYTLKDNECSDMGSDVASSKPETSVLIDFLTQKKAEESTNANAYNFVQEFIENNKRLFANKKDAFASQWGSIRSLAMVTPDSKQLIKNIDEYLDHGVAKDKWEERGRKKSLDAFMEKHVEDNLQDIMINLASEMAKRCKNK